MKRLLLCCLLLAGPVHAASFSCAKARSAVEKAICGDPKLSSQDEQLAEAYKTALLKAGTGAAAVRQDQRAWLKNLDASCGGDSQIQACIARHQADRIQALAVTPAGAAPAASARYTKVSAHYDYEVRRPAAAQGQDAGTSGTLLIYAKGGTTPIQSIAMDDVSFVDGQDGIVVDDFNFDGNEDLALQTSGDGPYGSGTYDIYLYSPTKKGFEFSTPLTQLLVADDAMGLFEVDAARKQLTTDSKDGCCFHSSSIYKLIDNKPLLFAKHTEDATKGDGYVHITDGSLVNGKWQEKETKEKADQ